MPDTREALDIMRYAVVRLLSVDSIYDIYGNKFQMDKKDIPILRAVFIHGDLPFEDRVMLGWKLYINTAHSLVFMDETLHSDIEPIYQFIIDHEAPLRDLASWKVTATSPRERASVKGTK